MKRKKVLSLLLAALLCLSLLPAPAAAANAALTKADAQAYADVINGLMQRDVYEANSYITDFDGDGRGELFLIWADDNGYSTNECYLWTYRYEVYLGSKKLTEGSYGYWASYELCMDSAGRTRFVGSIYGDGRDSNIYWMESYIRSGAWVTDTYSYYLEYGKRESQAEYRGPSGAISRADYEANVARMDSYSVLRSFSVYEFQGRSGSESRLFHSAWPEIDQALHPENYVRSTPLPSMDRTYWSISVGPTLGGLYYVHTYANGAYECVSNWGDKSTGTYTLRDGVLTFFGMQMIWNGSFFQALEDTYTWNGYGSGGFFPCLSPDPYRNYASITGEPVDTPTAASAGIPVLLDGKQVVFPDARPFIDANGRTLVPLRAVAEAMGLEVTWDAAARKATFSGTALAYDRQIPTSVSFRIGSNSATVYYEDLLDESNSITKTVVMDTQAVIVNSRTFAPIRYLAEAFGYEVGWDARKRQVELTSQLIYPDPLPTPPDLPRGQHVVRLDNRMLSLSGDGTMYLYVRAGDFYTYSHAFVSALQAGSWITTPWGGVRVETISRSAADVFINENTGNPVELQRLSDGRWAYCGGGIPVRFYTDGYRAVSSVFGTLYIDDYTYTMTGGAEGAPGRIMTAWEFCEFFRSYPEGFTFDLQVTVTDMGMTEARILYSP